MHTHVREDAIVLYGFATTEERRCFEALLGAHGVGPALALAVLSALRPADLVRAVLDEDLGALCTVPGVGRKTAARLVLDLRSRLELPAFAGDGVPGGTAAPPRRAARCGPRWPSSATGPRRSAGPSRAARTRARSRSCCARRSGSWRGRGERPARGAVDGPGRDGPRRRRRARRARPGP